MDSDEKQNIFARGQTTRREAPASSRRRVNEKQEKADNIVVAPHQNVSDLVDDGFQSYDQQIDSSKKFDMSSKSMTPPV